MRLLTPKFADDPDGLGFIEGFPVDFDEGLLVADFVALGVGFADGELVALGVGFADGELVALGVGEVIFSPSLTVTLIFWPGLRFSMPTFVFPCEVEGLIVGFAVEVADGFGVGFTDG